MENNNNSVTQLFIRKLPVALKKQFKAVCARQGVTMSHKIEQLIREEVERHEPGHHYTLH